MKQKFLPILALAFLAAALGAQPKSSDEDLILDEGDTPAAQPEKKTAVAPSVDTARKAAAADTGGAKKAADAQTIPAPKEARPQASAKDTAKKISDEELILDGGAEDLLGQEKSATKKTTAPAKTAAPAATDSSAAGAAAAAPAPVDSMAKAAGAAAAVDSGVPFVATPPPEQPAAPAEAEKIEKIRSINFAANLKEYRSPKLAMLMSLIIPGSGQFYAKSNLTAAACLAVEAALVGTGYAFVKQGQDKKKKARSYADEHYNADKFSNYDRDLRTFLSNTTGSDSIYYGIIYFGDSSAAANFSKDAAAKNDAYYDNITLSSATYVRGWDDVEPGFTADNGIDITDADTAMYGAFPGDSAYFAYKRKVPGKYPAYGFSENQVKYSDMVSQAQGLSRIGSRFYMSLLVNHLASAVLAGILAKKHNDELLGKESFWRRIDVEEQLVNTGTTVVSGYALAVRF